MYKKSSHNLAYMDYVKIFCLQFYWLSVLKRLRPFRTEPLSHTKISPPNGRDIQKNHYNSHLITTLSPSWSRSIKLAF